MPSTVTNAVYVYSIRLGSSLRSLVSQKRVFLGLTHSVSWILLPACTATLGPTAKPLNRCHCCHAHLPIPWEGRLSGKLMTLIIAIRASKSHLYMTEARGSRCSLRLSLGDLHPTQARAPSISNPNSQSLSTLDLRAQILTQVKTPTGSRSHPHLPDLHACHALHPTTLPNLKTSKCRHSSTDSGFRSASCFDAADPRDV